MEKRKPSEALVSWIANGKSRTKVDRDRDITCNLVSHRAESVRKYCRSLRVHWKDIYKGEGIQDISQGHL